MIIELRTVEEAEAALTLDGLVLGDNKLKFKRTADYWSYDLDYHN